ncbi:MAG: hypothetical protein WDZ40_02045 [Candidatus Spechtbacterales bacterium]
MKLKNEPYRCGECKLTHRVLLRDENGSHLKDSLGNYIYDTFTSDSVDEVLEHMLSEHWDEKKDIQQCLDCLYFYSYDNLPCGWDSAGGLMVWCYDCTQRRCLRYGILRNSLSSLLKEDNIKLMRKSKLIKEIKELLDS